MPTPLDVVDAPSGASLEGAATIAPRQTGRIAAYAVLLLLLFNLGSIGVYGIPLQFLLKNTFKLSPPQISVFTLLIDIPFYLGFAFGFIRDRWRPLGRGDRGYFLFLPLLMAGSLCLLGFGTFTYGRVLSVFAAVRRVFRMDGRGGERPADLHKPV